MTFLNDFFRLFYQIFLESSPWLLLGFAIAGVIKAFIPSDFLSRHLGNNDMKAVVKGAFFGAPIPLCSCGVIPAALGLRRAGASKASTTAFLIATPETGIDSVSISYALLGPFMAIIRPIAAIATAVAAGFGVFLLEKKQAISSRQCETIKNEEITSSCCASKKTVPTTEKTLFKKMLSGLHFTFFTLLTDISIWLLIGLASATFIMAVVPESFLLQWGSGPYAYIMMAVIGVPMYICATASTPVAAGLLFAGVSPGAILVFLLVGPATNMATLAIVRNELGSRILFIYLVSVVGISFLFGWVTDMCTSQFDLAIKSSHTHVHNSSSLFTIVCASILALLLINSLISRFQKFRKKVSHKSG